MASEAFESLLWQRHTKLRSRHADGDKLALLHMGAEKSGLVLRNGGSEPAEFVFALGTANTVRNLFRGKMPDAMALENAIAAVEDEIARLPAAFAASLSRLTLVSQDELVREIALRCGLQPAPQIQLPLETVEQCFDRLAKIAQGSPAGHQGLPEDPAFAAALLILREFMHHRQVKTISWIGLD